MEAEEGIFVRRRGVMRHKLLDINLAITPVAPTSIPSGIILSV